VAVLQHPVVVCHGLLVSCEVMVHLLAVEHVRRLLGRRRGRRKVRVEEAIRWPVWSRWCLERRRGRGRRKLVLEGAKALLATIKAARAEGHGIRIPRITHTGACGSSERRLGGGAVSTWLGLEVVGVSGRSCDWSAVGDAVPS
jgi:hypothetical protein